jgi:hypothetical protein
VLMLREHGVRLGCAYAKRAEIALGAKPVENGVAKL